MNLLLDTHVLLWWLDDHPDLSLRAKTVIADGQNLVSFAPRFYHRSSRSQALPGNADLKGSAF